MKTEFDNYIQSRMYYQRNRAWLKVSELENIIKEVDRLREMEIFPYEKNNLDDLKDDIEIRIDRLDDPADRSIEKRRSKAEMYHDIEPITDAIISVVNYDSSNLWKEIERELIKTTLNHFNWNKTKTAKCLGFCIKTLGNKLNEYKKQGLMNEYEIRSR